MRCVCSGLLRPGALLEIFSRAQAHFAVCVRAVPLMEQRRADAHQVVKSQRHFRQTGMQLSAGPCKEHACCMGQRLLHAEAFHQLLMRAAHCQPPCCPCACSAHHFIIILRGSFKVTSSQAHNPATLLAPSHPPLCHPARHTCTGFPQLHQPSRLPWNPTRGGHPHASALDVCVPGLCCGW